eukprot:TRINITY_DN43477_c0_g1_i1.p1 TRINITY_DN43477_c0_g1~~TRINITY_DN43477_c0_g1_i1.p1  ORF type:complete len:551 (-),score=96.25 TRINITY_DN43477_c0_g1_i1:171-1823(-)
MADRIVDASFFQGGSGGDAPSLKPYVVNEDPLIAVIPNFLANEEIEHLLHLSEGRWSPSAIDVADGQGVSRSVTSIAGRSHLGHGALCQQTQTRNSDSCILLIGETPIVQTIEDRLCRLVGMRVEHLESLAMVRYFPGQYFKCHHDGGIRPWTVFLYLNDLPVEDSGATHFPHVRLRMQPRKGCAVMWPNSRLDGQADRRLEHQGLPPRKGVKYGVNCFFNVRPVRPTAKCHEDADDDDQSSISTTLEEGKDKILSEKTFGYFLSMATKESAPKVLRLEVSTAKTQDEAPSRQSHGAWQEDPRNLDELLALFSDEDVKSNTEPLTCARRSRKNKQKKKEGTRNTPRLAEESQLNDEHQAQKAETARPEGDKDDYESWQEGPDNVGNGAVPEVRKRCQSEELTMAEEVYIQEGKETEQEALGNVENHDWTREDEAEQMMERHKMASVGDCDVDDDEHDVGFKQYTETNLDSDDGLSRSKSCPCLLTHSMAKETPKASSDSAEQSPENVGRFWPATPDCTPPSSPRQGCGQHHMAWVPMPVWFMPMMPAAAY